MKIEYLLRKKTEWLKGTGPEADIVLSTRIRLARNLRGKNFTRRASESQRREILKQLIAAAESSDYLKGSLLVELEKVSGLDRQFLEERRLISRELSPRLQGAVIVSEREVISLSINEEDHLRMQVLQSGLRLFNCWRLIDRVDSELGEKLDYEFSPVLGYLTACPTNVGTGMRASVMVHLPALVLNKQIGQILRAVGKLGLTVRGVYGEGTEAEGNLFQISNQVTLGKSEEEIIRNLEKIIEKIITRERDARRVLLEDKSPRLEDRIYRARGILRNARLISSQETINLLSGLRMGVDLGILSGISRGSVNQLFIRIQPAHLQKLAGKSLSPEERDLLRAKLIREKLSDTDKTGKREKQERKH